MPIFEIRSTVDSAINLLMIIIGVTTFRNVATAQERVPTGASAKPITFQVKLGDGVKPSGKAGRLFVAFSRAGEQGAATGRRGRQSEPRFAIGSTGADVPTVLAVDVADIGAGPVTVGPNAYVYPQATTADIRSGKYVVQALFDSSRDIRNVNAPGNLFGAPTPIDFDRSKPLAVDLELKSTIDEPKLADMPFVKWIKLESKKLSDFHGRPIYLRAGVVLPKSFEKSPDRKYPLLVQIGGFGTRYSFARFVQNEIHRLTTDSQDDMVVLCLDGAGPLGDPYQVDSANHGPYGSALTEELIPHVEKTFRCLGRPETRFTHGASTGGWVSLALVLFYPDYFGGCYSKCPDSLDFRAFELVDIYRDKNAYVNRHGFERPAKRDRFGDVLFTLKNECFRENMMGRGDSYVFSGQDWGSWNATFGPRNDDGKPKPIWNPATGEIDRSVVNHWEKYDLRLVLQRSWERNHAKLNGKIYIWVGEADDYFLNKGVELFRDAANKLKPKFEGTIVIEQGATHTDGGISTADMIKEIGAKTRRLPGEK